MKRLQGKVAIVTGSSSGIGRAIALGYAREGAKIVCSDINQSAREQGYEDNLSISTEQAIQDMGGEAIYVKCDVSDVEQVKHMVQAAVDKFGRLDIMVNNAGVFTRMGPIHEKTDYDWDYTMSVNAKGVWNGCQQAIVQFLKQGNGGKIVNIVSIGGLVGLALEPAYCASKGAAANLTRQLAVDYGTYKINVNGICPNFLPTAMCRPYYDDQNVRQVVENVTPMGRWGEPVEIVGPAIFLASSEADYITGHMLTVDGGYTCK